MGKFEQADQLVSELSLDERARLLRRVLRDLGEDVPGIERSPEVSGGEARIVRTRIPVWLLERARRLGTSDAEVLRAYPSLRSADLAHARTYAESHPEEIERQIVDNENA